jgi:hypothetical protein
VSTEGNGWQLPPPPWAQLAADRPGVTGPVLDRLAGLSVPQPWATATSPVRTTGAWEKVPRTHVLCSFGVAELRAMAGSVPAFRHMTGEGLEFRELPGWHWPMIDQAAELAAILHEAGSQDPGSQDPGRQDLGRQDGQDIG